MDIGRCGRPLVVSITPPVRKGRKWRPKQGISGEFMKTRNKKRILGFTIIELMIVVGIVAILLAIAYPSYIKYVRKGNRGEAQQLLMNWAINQEIWRSNNVAYATTAQLTAPTGDKYTFDTVGTPDATTYILEATATGDQVNDVSRDGATSCATLRLNQNGVKTPAVCWE